MEDGSAYAMFAAAAFAYASGPTAPGGGGNGPVPDPVPDPDDEGDPPAGILPVSFPELPGVPDMTNGPSAYGSSDSTDSRISAAVVAAQAALANPDCANLFHVGHDPNVPDTADSGC